MLIQSYKDMVKELEAHEKLLDIAETNKKYYLQLFDKKPAEVKSINMDGMPKGCSNDLSFDRIVEGIQHWDYMMQIEQNNIDRVKARLKEIDDAMKNIEGLQFQVVYKRDIENRSLQEIADELGYAYSTVANISAKYPRK